MLGVNNTRIFVQSAQEIDRAARAAMDNISKQLAKMPPMKKPASAADNFPWIYNNPNDFLPHTLGFKNPVKPVIKDMNANFALNVYKNAG